MNKSDEFNEALSRFSQGTSTDAYKIMGSHKEIRDGQEGFAFRVWAPHARSVRVAGSFNGWATDGPAMEPLDGGVWEGFVPGLRDFDDYKYYIERPDGSFVFRGDPYACHWATRPGNSSKVYDLQGFPWTDGAYLKARAKKKLLNSPVNIYEMHLGSWRTHDDGNPYNYVDLAYQVADYVTGMGYTHVELLPVSEYPYDPSWGYQVTGYYAPTSRYGTPKDFMKFVDILHNAGIGVIIDWVPAHFPRDEQGLFEYDGDCCYEPADPVMRDHPDWGTRVFDYSRYEVRSFLMSNAMYWLEEYHIDGIRVDAVASMLYLDYGRRDREWHPNRDGGNINLDAVQFLRDVNAAALSRDPNVLMIAEESTAFPMVTKPGYDGGLGFNFKWNMGWMHDMVDYMSTDPLFRKGRHNNITFSLTYAFSENFILPLSHDEVVHGKCSLINKMPGEYDDKFQNLRTFYGYMMTHPGKKLLFMGGEFGQFIEWDEKRPLDWFLLDYDKHRQLQEYVKDLNRFYLDHPALWANDTDWQGFQWIACDDADQSVISFRRIDPKGKEVIVVCNFCPVQRDGYVIGAPKAGTYVPVLSSDDAKYGGRGTKLAPVSAKKVPQHGLPWSIELTLPAMSAVFYERKVIRHEKAEDKAETSKAEPARRGRKPKAEAAPAGEKPVKAKKTASRAKKAEAPRAEAVKAEKKPSTRKTAAKARPAKSKATK